MADKVFDPQEWFTSVVPEGVTLSDEQVQARDLLLADPAIAKNIGNSVLRQSDYSRKSDELATEREAAATLKQQAVDAKAEADAFVVTQKDRDHNNLTLHESLVKDLATANARVDELGGEVVPARVEPEPVVKEPDVKYLTAEDYEAREAQRDANTIEFSSRMIQLANQHQSDFGEAFDPAPVVKHATEQGLSLDDAYADLHKDRFAEKTEADVLARIATAVQEKEIELRSANDFPEIDSGPQRVSGLDQAEEDKLKTEGDRARAAVTGLAEIRGGKRPVTDNWN